MINDALTIKRGTFKTFEHAASNFKFRAEGDGAFEPALIDKFSPEAPALEALDDRRFRAFLKKEQGLQSAESSTRTAEAGKAELQKMVTGTLGEGWTVSEYNAPLGGVPNVTELQFQDGGATQEISIDRYSRPAKVTLSSTASIDGWKVDQSLSGSLTDGAITDLDTGREEVFFTKY